jgi:hypothetical protein
MFVATLNANSGGHATILRAHKECHQPNVQSIENTDGQWQNVDSNNSVRNSSKPKSKDCQWKWKTVPKWLCDGSMTWESFSVVADPTHVAKGPYDFCRKVAWHKRAQIPLSRSSLGSADISCCQSQTLSSRFVTLFGRCGHSKANAKSSCARCRTRCQESLMVTLCDPRTRAFFFSGSNCGFGYQQRFLESASFQSLLQIGLERDQNPDLPGRAKLGAFSKMLVWLFDCTGLY